jgi:hypothetical protein
MSIDKVVWKDKTTPASLSTVLYGERFDGGWSYAKIYYPVSKDEKFRVTLSESQTGVEYKDTFWRFDKLESAKDFVENNLS